MYDLIIIGAGPAGYVAAERAGHRGLKTLLVEREEHLGGICLNWGCIPTKALLASAKAYYGATHAAEFGVEVPGALFRLEQAMARKQKVQDQLRQGIRGLMRKFKVEVQRGTARLEGPGRVRVGETLHETKHILVATGSRPAAPPIPGRDLPHVLDSTGILQLERLPKKLCIVGGGVIGCEFACFFAMVGVEVSVVEMVDEILPGLDADCAKVLREALISKGVSFHLGARVAGIDAQAVSGTDAAGTQLRIEADCVLLCTGRCANSEDLGLEACGVELHRGGIVADDRCRTNVPGIWAAGDVCGRVMLAHVASRHAEVAVDAICGGDQRLREHAIPGVVYTSPEVAGVGRTLESALKAGLPAKAATWPLAANGRNLAEGGGKGLVKVVYCTDDRRILGVHAVGASCSEFIATAVAMLEHEARLDEVAEYIFPHPTASEAIKDAVLLAH